MTTVRKSSFCATDEREGFSPAGKLEKYAKVEDIEAIVEEKSSSNEELSEDEKYDPTKIMLKTSMRRIH
ncbi:hypothetical protein K1719_039649 [Acacia pycnantha]|nr:hypothetical protein K1719_039649 [Acacia pycnantha]